MLGALTFAIVPSCSNNKMFETFSYLPPLSDDQIARQVDYIVNNGWTPCLEFSEPELAYVQSTSTDRMGAVSSVSKSFSAQAIFSSMALAEAFCSTWQLQQYQRFLHSSFTLVSSIGLRDMSLQQ